MAFNDIGFEMLGDILTQDEVADLAATLQDKQLKPLRGGIRRIEQLVPQVKSLSKSDRLTSLAQNYLADKPYLVRAIYFDKTPENNWFVTWHQDRTVAVSERFEAEGWGPWSLKAEAWHVQPPLDVLENMITIRLHLDSSTVANGCLKFIPGSHRHGIVKSSEVQRHVQNSQIVYCEAPAGSAIVMRPHIFHASEKAVTPTPRRVLHFEYSCHVLPKGISWLA